MKEKRASKKYFAEVAILVLAFIISFTMKAILIFLDFEFTINNNQDYVYNFIDIVSRILSSVYAVIGGLQFEGLTYQIGDTVLSNSLISYLYFGTSILAGAIMLSIITATVSYEIYSRIKLRYFIKKNSKIDFFVFTSLTEDALILAKDIKKKCEERKRNFIIIFSGTDLDSFDSKNELCREVIANSFLYYSLFKEIDNAHSVLERLNIYLPNIKCLCDNPISQLTCSSEIHLFSMKLDNYLIPCESDNSSYMFEEVEIQTRRLLEKISKKYSLDDLINNKIEKIDEVLYVCKAMIIDLHVLTAKNINYEFYQSNLEQIICSQFLEIDPSIDIKNLKSNSKFYKFIRSCFQFHLINEALISSKTFAIERHKLLKGSLIESSQFRDDSIYRTMVLGFGATGQYVMNAAFIDSTYVLYEEGRQKSSQFVANVFDERIGENSGIFALSHPLFMYKDCNNSLVIPSVSEIMSENIDRFKRIYYDLDVKKDEKFFDEMKFPCISFHKTSCTDISFIKLLDDSTGTTSKKNKNLFDYNLFVFAMGNDEKNISMANALIDDIKQELNKIKNNEEIIRQSLAINIRDEKNYYRINWTLEDSEKYPSIKIIKFGNRNDIYSYEQIINEKKGIIYYYAYNNFSSHSNFQNIRDVLNITDEEESGNYYDYIKDMTETDKFQNFEKHLKREKFWLLVPMFDKESNYNANLFAQNIREFANHVLKNEKCITSKELRVLAYFEHQRWNRFYIANAWIYMKAKDKKNRHHNCILPFDNIPVSDPGQENNKAYDVVNVSLALFREHNK